MFNALILLNISLRWVSYHHSHSLHYSSSISPTFVPDGNWSPNVIIPISASLSLVTPDSDKLALIGMIADQFPSGTKVVEFEVQYICWLLRKW